MEREDDCQDFVGVPEDGRVADEKTGQRETKIHECHGHGVVVVPAGSRDSGCWQGNVGEVGVERHVNTAADFAQYTPVWGV